MTYTDLPKIIGSTMYRAAEVNAHSTQSKTHHYYKQCDATYISPHEDRWTSTKGHCHIFDTAALHKPKYNTIEMEHPHRQTESFTANPEVVWNTIAQQQRHRVHHFSSPDLYNSRVTPQPLTSERTGEVSYKRRNRARSTPRIQTGYPVPTVKVKGSPPRARKDHDFSRSPKHRHREAEVSQKREATHPLNWALINQLNPINLQPQKTDPMYTPYYVTDMLHEVRPDKLSTSPHVKCRVDIKPDEAALQQHGPKSPTPKVHLTRARYASSGSQSLIVPLNFSVSRTPTPTEPFTGDYRVYQYSQTGPNTYPQPLRTPQQTMPDQEEMTDFYGVQQRVHASPNVSRKFGCLTKARTYNEDDYFIIPNQTRSPKVHYAQDLRNSVLHTLPVRPHFTQPDPYHGPPPEFPKPYASNTHGQYVLQTPLTHTFCMDDHRKVPPQIFYVGDPYEQQFETHISAYYPENLHHAHVVQPQSHDWYGSDVSGYSTQYPNSQASSTLVRQEPMLAHWYNNSCMELTKNKNDSKPYSKSWDNILSTHVEREQPVSRKKSDDSLLCLGKPILSSNDGPKPMVVNLSSSPRRYAALSLSDNSLIEKSPSNAKSTSSKQWFVTPEITITDNDIKPNKAGKAGESFANAGIQDSRKSPDKDVSYSETVSKKNNSVSLKQSLEQLDKLLADLVTDYNPPTFEGSDSTLLDQVKTPTAENETLSSGIMNPKAGLVGSIPLDKQPASFRIDSNIMRDTERSCDEFQSTEECSPGQSPEEDDTMICSNNKCRRIETLFNACLYFKSCHSCYTYYCSRNCRREDWYIHKESCLYGRIGSVCRHIIKYCRETVEVHRAFSRIAKVGYLSRGRGVLFLGFPNTGSSTNFLQFGLESLLVSPTYLSVRELEGYKDNLGEYYEELQEAGKEYDPNECFLLNVSIAIGEQVLEGPSPRVQTPTVRKYAKVALASFSPEKKVQRKENDMETLILTPPPGTADMDKEGEEGKKAREICFINIQRELRIRGVFLRHEYPQVYQKLCEFVENNRRFTPTTIYPIDKRSGKQFMCMIMAASEPRTLDWVATPHLLDDII